MKIFSVFLLLCAAPLRMMAEEHNVPAASGALQAVIYEGRVMPGDRILLADGWHGSLTVRGQTFDPPLVISASPGSLPRFGFIDLRRTAGIVLEGVTVMPQNADDIPSALITLTDVRDIVLDGLTVASAPETTDWTTGDWERQARHGIWLSGARITLRNNMIRNVKHGITTRANDAKVQNNFIELFAGDGIRGQGNNSEYTDNTIDTCVNIDDNHDDGFQAWSVNRIGLPGRGVIRNVRLERNLIRNGTHPSDCRLQGIGLFDGFYENWIIRDNTVIVNHWHGITVMGAQDVIVEDNIAVDTVPGTPGPPWITITAHKNGRSGTGNLLSDNVTQSSDFTGGETFQQPQPGVEVRRHRQVTSPRAALSLAGPAGQRPSQKTR